jgi:hypothetical protein
LIAGALTGMLFITACSTQTNDFTRNETNISAIKLDIGCMIGDPYGLIYLDPLILFYDRFEKQCVTVFDVKNKQFVRRFISVGQGPGEVVLPVSLFVSPVDKKICAFQTQISRLNMYEPDAVIAKDPVTRFEQIRFEGRPEYIKKIKDGYVGIGMFEDGRFRLYDSLGNIVSACGIYPFQGKEMDFKDRFIIYQGYVSTSADGNSFAIGTSYCDNLEFYRITDGNAVLVKKYESYDVKGVFYGNRIRIDDDCIMNYKDAYGGKYCYMLYSGKPYLDNGSRISDVSGRRIIVFDWNGNYIRSYKADVDIFSFCVDEENNIIYALIYDDNDETEGGFSIVQFNI